MILGRNIFWSLYISNIIYYFQASVSIRSRYSLYIDDCVSTTKHSNPGAPPGVLGIWGEGLFIFRELGSTANYFRGAGEQAHTFGDLGSTAKK